ncbi:abscisic acid receptor PYL12-like [Ananas comosus]|uniref:Abscisic acid receptor PYL12-like n=1 Tax=Ananas comosus TaxID=4615 RepID=A0A6P5FZP6_ANACO|nr:abscisic acid receptor PYL12-like [Ananas comosus]
MPRLPTAAEGAQDEAVRRHDRGAPAGPGQCGAVHVQHVSAPVPLVWSLVRRFDRPQCYKGFVRACGLLPRTCGGAGPATGAGEMGVGSVREVRLVSGLPARTSTERLDALDEERHVTGFTVLGGDHRLANYRSATSLHAAGGDSPSLGTIVVESYVVDVPRGSTAEETRAFADTIVRCNLRSLATVCQTMAARSASNGSNASTHM